MSEPQRKRSRPRVTKALVKEALEKNHGIQAYAAEALGVTRQVVCQWVAKHPDLKAICEQAKLRIVDVAKGTVVQSMNSPDAHVRLRAATKVMEYWGRDQIDPKRVELTGPNGGPVQFDMSVFSDEDLEQLRSLRRKLDAAAGGDRGGDRAPQG